MTDILAILNPYRWLLLAGLVLAMAVGLVVAKHHYDEGKRAEGRAEVQAKWDRDRDAQKTAAIAEAARNAQETTRRLAEQRKAQETHDAQLAQAQHDAVAADRAAVSLRSQLAQFTATARRAAGNPTAVGSSPPAAAAVDLLADMLGESEGATGELAKSLDLAYTAGQLCERQYDSLTVKP